MRPLSILALAAVFALATGLRADDEPTKKKGGKKGGPTPSAEEQFKKADKNDDGKLSLDEYKDSIPEDRREGAKKRFEAMDTDKDGNVTLAEFKKAAEERAMKHGKRGKGAKNPAAAEKKSPDAAEKKPAESK